MSSFIHGIEDGLRGNDGADHGWGERNCLLACLHCLIHASHIFPLQSTTVGNGMWTCVCTVCETDPLEMEMEMAVAVAVAAAAAAVDG